MSLLNAVKKVFSEENQIEIDNLYELLNNIKEEVVYRKNGKNIDKIIQLNANTGSKIKTTYYDYFDDKKIRSVDEYDPKSGRKIRTINYVLYKSIDEYDPQTGKKTRTINFNIKDETKVSSIQEYDQETQEISKIYIYKRDGKSINVIKNVNSKSITKIENKPQSKQVIDNIPNVSLQKPNNEIANLIDKLYGNSLSFDAIK